MWTEKLNLASKFRKLENDYELSEEVLGQGSYGKVIKAKNKKSGETVAIKQINKKGLQNEELIL